MHKHWLALLSIAGLAGSTVPVEAQAVKDGKVKAESKTDKSKAKFNATGKKGSGGKLTVKQQTVRQQNQAAPPAFETWYGKKNAQITKGDKAQLTKGNNPQLTKGNNPQLTKGKDAQLTK
jgi:hypothetical protein